MYVFHIGLILRSFYYSSLAHKANVFTSYETELFIFADMSLRSYLLTRL